MLKHTSDSPLIVSGWLVIETGATLDSLTSNPGSVAQIKLTSAPVSIRKLVLAPLIIPST